MERYDRYKASSAEWIGEIPSTWQSVKIKYEFDVVAGATPKSGVGAYWDGDIPWVSPADFSDTDRYVFSGRRSLTKDGVDSCGTTIVPKGSIIVSNRAPIGRVSIAGNSLCTNQGCKALVKRGAINELIKKTEKVH